MQERDLHSALSHDVIAQASRGGVDAALVRSHWGRNDSAYTLHTSSSSWSPAGLQTKDLLAYLFDRYDYCPFLNNRQCYAKYVTSEFDIEDLLATFERAYEDLRDAERGLAFCGYEFPDTEESNRFRRNLNSTRVGNLDDGHTAQNSETLRKGEDDFFHFLLSFIDTGLQKKFVTHFRPKHPPLSRDIRSVFNFLKLKSFSECPEFGFEECHFHSRVFSSEYVENVHRAFEENSDRFSAAIKKIITANKEFGELGVGFLFHHDRSEKGSIPQGNLVENWDNKTSTSEDKYPDKSDIAMPKKFDVAISVAGPDREHALKLAKLLRERKIEVFLDEYYPEHLWGKDLAELFDDIFRNRSTYCVMFISKEYKDRMWTKHERRSALARQLKQESEYILPIRIDETKLDGLAPTIGYLQLKDGIPKIAELIVSKIRSR